MTEEERRALMNEADEAIRKVLKDVNDNPPSVSWVDEVDRVLGCDPVKVHLFSVN